MQTHFVRAILRLGRSSADMSAHGGIFGKG